jgi:predicted Na+-dependent transporter
LGDKAERFLFCGFEKPLMGTCAPAAASENPRVMLDRYLIILILTVALAGLVPAQGGFAAVLSNVTFWAVALLFFLYGAKLSLSAALAGLTNWKLQAGCLACTYILFPVLATGPWH